MKHWKKGTTMIATAGLVCALAMPAWADSSTSIYYNEQLLNTKESVLNDSGRTLMAFRDFFEAMDAEVVWSEEFRMATATYGKNTVTLFPDTGAAQVNGEPKALAVGPKMIDGRIYLPLRFVAESLGGTVDYTKDAASDHGTIKINTIDSVQNFAVKDGKVMSILRTTQHPANTTTAVEKEDQAAYSQWQKSNEGYFVDDNGNFIEIFTYDNMIRVNTIDLANAKVTTKDYTSKALYPAIFAIQRQGDSIVLQLNDTQNNRYVGVGTPVNSNYLQQFETRYGDYTMYNGNEMNEVFKINGNTGEASGVMNVSEQGYVIDLANRYGDAKSTAYARTDNGSYAFLSDGHLLIVDSDQKKQYDEVLSTEIAEGKVYAYNDQFIILGVEAGLTYPELYAAVYSSNGTQQYYYHNISNLSKANDDKTFYGYDYLRVVDMIQLKNKIYTLVNNGWERYVITYNANDNTSTVEELDIKDHLYDRFILAPDGVKLMAKDNDYYYLRDCE